MRDQVKNLMPKKYNTMFTILYDMTNTLISGIPGVVFYVLQLLKRKGEIQKMKSDLLDKYATKIMITLPMPEKAVFAVL